MLFAMLGQIRMGYSNALTGPTAITETRANTIYEHQVLRGKPIPQRAGQELDKKAFSFFFDESFCDPQAEYSKLTAAHASGIALPFIFGNGGYLGKSYMVKTLNCTFQKSSTGGRVTRLEANIELLEVPGGLGGIFGAGIASLARAVKNPFAKR